MTRGRTIGLVVLFATSMWTIRIAADEAAEEIVGKAVEAIGGQETLSRFNAATWEETGTYHGMGQPLPYTGSYAIQFPDQFVMEIENAFKIVLNGEGAWVRSPVSVDAMDENQSREYREMLHQSRALQLFPLLEPEYTLTSMGESEIDGNLVLGVRASTDGHRDIELFFDAETFLLVKSSRMGVSPEFGEDEITMDTYYADYRESRGVMFAHRLTMKYDDELFVEAEIEDYTPVESLDDSVFDKPTD